MLRIVGNGYYRGPVFQGGEERSVSPGGELVTRRIDVEGHRHVRQMVL
jgi:hypothetical protein